MSLCRRARILRLLDLYQGNLDRARGHLLDAVAAENAARSGLHDSIARYRTECQASMTRFEAGAASTEFAQAAQWRSTLLRCCENAEQAHDRAASKTLDARKDLEQAYRAVETMRALLARIDREVATQNARQLRRDEDAFALLRRATTSPS